MNDEKVELGAKDRGIFFNVKNCPQDTFARFHEFCDVVSKDAGLTFASYPLGLKTLLDEVKPVGEEKKEEDEDEGIKTFGGKK